MSSNTPEQGKKDVSTARPSPQLAARMHALPEDTAPKEASPEEAAPAAVSPASAVEYEPPQRKSSKRDVLYREFGIGEDEKMRKTDLRSVVSAFFAAHAWDLDKEWKHFREAEMIPVLEECSAELTSRGFQSNTTKLKRLVKTICHDNSRRNRPIVKEGARPSAPAEDGSSDDDLEFVCFSPPVGKPITHDSNVRAPEF
jgi:hypothetical protein